MQQTSSRDAARALPSGTVTFLFSDIEGSTERWDKHREAMQEALKSHDAVLRSVIEAQRGHVFKTIGDAFCTVFHSAPNAIAAAIDAEGELAKHDWSDVGGLKVRMAVHTGVADERGGDYFGPTVNRVARLLSIGHGGQVLVSGVSTELCQGLMPANATLRDLGAHRLRDLTYPEQVYQLVAPGLAIEFPPLRSLDALPNNLPIQLTNLVGREDDIAEIEELLTSHRLVTLVGAGGVGKTRLSLQVAAELLDKFEDGVWFVDLAPLNDARLIPSTAATALGIGQQAERSITDSLVKALKHRRLLIILDNCEHVVVDAAKLADSLLRGCPQLRILASSREGLGIDGEAVLRVPSLAVPETGEKLSAVEANRYGSIALFVERATAADRRFKLTDQNAGKVAQICEQLDGIALAIELAATRVKVLSVEQIATRLNDRFRILSGGNRTALPRQQTMRALIDWSYDLLSDNEKTLFRRVSVFAGGWSLDAANEICTDVRIEALDVLDLLSALVDKSMVVAELSGAEQRYRLLASTRQYALELLQQSGETETLLRKHCEFFHQVAAQADEAWSTTSTTVWVLNLLPENDNFRAAIDWALTEKHDVELGVALTAALGRFWLYGPQPAEGRLRLAQALQAIPEGSRPDREAPLLVVIAGLETRAARYQRGLDAATRAHALFTTLGSRQGVALSLNEMGEPLLRMRKHAEASRALDEALEIHKERKQPRLIGTTITQQARNLSFAGQFEESRALYTEALASVRRTGDQRTLAVIVTNMAEMDFYQGNAERALATVKEIFPTLPAWDKQGKTIALANMAAYLIALQRLAEAREPAREALKSVRDLGPVLLGESIQHLACIALGFKKPQVAARLAGFCEKNYRESQTTLDFTEQQEFDGLMKSLKESLGEPELLRLMHEGAALSDDQAIEEALNV